MPCVDGCTGDGHEGMEMPGIRERREEDTHARSPVCRNTPGAMTHMIRGQRSAGNDGSERVFSVLVGDILLMGRAEQPPHVEIAPPTDPFLRLLRAQRRD